MKLQFKAKSNIDAYRQAKDYVNRYWVDYYVFVYSDGVGTLYLRGVE